MLLRKRIVDIIDILVKIKINMNILVSIYLWIKIWNLLYFKEDFCKWNVLGLFIYIYLFNKVVFIVWCLFVVEIKVIIYLYSGNRGIVFVFVEFMWVSVICIMMKLDGESFFV